MLAYQVLTTWKKCQVARIVVYSAILCMLLGFEIEGSNSTSYMQAYFIFLFIQKHLIPFYWLFHWCEIVCFLIFKTSFNCIYSDLSILIFSPVILSPIYFFDEGCLIWTFLNFPFISLGNLVILPSINNPI